MYKLNHSLKFLVRAIHSFTLITLLYSCQQKIFLKQPLKQEITGSTFYQQAKDLNGKQFDSLAIEYILAGNAPSFMHQLVPVKLAITHKGKIIRATIYTTADYISIGTNTDWARVPLTPMAAQKIADHFECFLPTQKIVDDIYRQSALKVSPIPLTQNRESPSTMYDHHLQIQKQYNGLPVFIAGIKKDVVITEKLFEKPGKVAIYGWHKRDSIPIQPLYTGHASWYTDYSHGIRLIYNKIKVNGKWIPYETLLMDSVLSKLITYEPANNFTRYSY